MSHNLDGKIALVTGASRGIGAATARTAGDRRWRSNLTFLSSAAKMFAKALRAEEPE